ncbi:MAG: hypothetical protein U9N55_08170 [candidate division Zixibacteria bacterium]|nr:hypothetical protein [candidate division Zixibacteria bacterium]
MKLLSRYTFIFAVLITALSAGCVYYNTFHNAKKAFNHAEDSRKDSKYGHQNIDQSNYKKAIEKSLKVIENHPDSKYYDDALHVLVVSYFWTEQYGRAEWSAREMIANYEDSKYVKNARLYLAKAKLEQGDEIGAMVDFEALLNEDIDRNYKVDAAMALGKFNFENRRYSDAERFFLLIRDSIGTSDEQKIAQRYIADGRFEQFQFKDARGAYLQILGMEPNLEERYHSLFRAANCSYNILQIDEGMDYLKKLMENEKYYDSLNVLRMSIAEGFDWEGDIEQAELMYHKVASEAKRKTLIQKAQYNLGLIYQYEYDKLTEAKEYYDKAIDLGHGSDAGKGALLRSSNIGKLDKYARTIEIDSTTSKEAIDEAAFTQFQLSELLWIDLNKPDTAILEMQYLIDSFPTSYIAPNAMISLSQMIRKHQGDSAVADSILRSVLENYPKSDYVPEALEALSLTGTAADTGYAAFYLKKAEHFLVDEENIDSARANYQTIVDRFEDSQYYLLARFSLIWLTETYESPGDSSVYLAYKQYADSFPGTDLAGEAMAKTKYQPSRQIQQPVEGQEDSAEVDNAEIAGDESEVGDSLGSYVDPEAAMYVTSDGGMAMDLPNKVEVIETREPFEYPAEAYGSKWEGEIAFQIKLDFSGEVVDLVQKTWSSIDEINIRAEEAVRSMVFNAQLLPPEELKSWWMYKMTIVLPSNLR